MTRHMNVTSLTDGELARTAATGDRAAVGELYRRYGNALYAFCSSMLHQPEDAADTVQDTFVRASQRIGQLREPERVKAWLFAIARRECYLRTTKRSRTSPVDPMDLNETIAADARTAGGLAESRELTELVRAATAGLTEEDRAVLELRMQHELGGRDLADALGVPVSQVHKVEARAIDRFERSVIALVLVRGARKNCDELADIVGDTSDLSPILRKRIARHVEACDNCERRKKLLVNPASMVASAAPLQPPANLDTRILDAIKGQPTLPTPTYGWDRNGFPRIRRIRKWPVVAAGVLGALFVGGITASGLANRTTTTSVSATSTTATPATSSSSSSSTSTTVVTTSTTTATSTMTSPTTTPIATTSPTTVAAVATTNPPSSTPTTVGSTTLRTTAPRTTTPRTTTPRTTRRTTTRKPRATTTSATTVPPTVPTTPPTLPPTIATTPPTIPPTEPTTVPSTVPTAVTTLATTTSTSTTSTTTTSTRTTKPTTASTTTTTIRGSGGQSTVPPRITINRCQIVLCNTLVIVVIQTTTTTTTTQPPILIN